MSGTNTPDDRLQFHPGYGHGGVPWFLMLLYVGYLTFFTWYHLENLLPNYQKQGPLNPAQSEAPK